MSNASRLQELNQRLEEIKQQQLSLDLTRGKPATAQLDLCNGLDGALQGDYRCADGTDSRNYGGGLGIPEAREFAAEYLDAKVSQVMVGGNSSLQLMYQYVVHAYLNGVSGPESAWVNDASNGERIKFLCPAPGYDRHFSVCESLGIEMIPVTMDENGPDMDQVESLLKSDPLIKGIWCVPKYANPNGIVYSDEVVARFARLGKIAGANFRIMWDNAYAEHHLADNPPELANLLALSEAEGTAANAIIIGSTSKITFAGAGISFIASAEENIKNFVAYLGISTIGPDKVNQLRHMRFIKNMDGLRELMQSHRNILQPKFELVLKHLDEGLGDKTVNGKAIGTWTRPQGGYFILFDTQPGLATRVIELCADAGVKLTPAGSTWPYKKDPANTNIRLAPSFPSLEEIDAAMQVFVLCVEIATLEQAA
ncbi:putative aminotransferase [Pseudohongiella nitratireducens]|uniref:Aminotransferase n=1 Tax=Pseudohongiella nitratireducens TaxID=1768907 RepID=A0A916VJZ3_9GAMM|nr:aminotransferase class I/II-fold pyridoxal phosphate-dependent enzyme [Pseudohongiella nitratireducens]GFZ81406.1 putative aminotransferase [Pseudohongiella nitratireducens]|tara:strand:+ start:8731 stop:10005 length:1275 start_codon:yes stop_codon:yes gene_type:complete